MRRYLGMGMAVAIAAAGFIGLAPDKAQAQEEYVVGVTGALSGPAGTLFNPLVDGLRIYFDRVNDQGGIAGRKVKLIIRDSANDPLRVVADLKAFADMKEIVGVVFASASGTVGAYTKESAALKMPTLFLNPCYPPATPPKPAAEFFCPGISSYVEALTLVDLMFELHGKEGMKLGFVTSDVPGARIVAQRIMAPYAEKKGATVVDVAVAPMATTDLGPVIRNMQDKGANAIISYTYNHHMLGAADAVDRLKFAGKYLLVAELPGVLSQVEQLKNPNIYASDQFSLLSEGKPVHKEILDAIQKYGFKYPVADARFGWRGAMVLGAALQKCGWPCTREKLVTTMGTLSVDSQAMLDLNGTPVAFNETTHTSVEKGFRVYHWETGSNSLKIAVDWFKKPEQNWPSN